MFEEDYYINSKVSNYINYTEKKFDGLARDIINILELNPDSKILDFGCATGQLVKALKDEGMENVVGTDISFWSTEWGRKNLGLSSKELQHYNRQLLEKEWDCVLLLDVLEHIELEELKNILKLINSDSVVARIPVALKEGEELVLEVSRNDKSHIQVHDKKWWINTIFEYSKLNTVQPLYEKCIYESTGVMSRIFRRKEV